MANGNGRKRNGNPPQSGGDEDSKGIPPGPIIRAANGQFAPGCPKPEGSGRKPGTSDGIRSLRKLIGDIAQEMVDSGEIKAYFQKLRDSGQDGIHAILHGVMMEFLKKTEADAGLDLRIELGIGEARTSPPPGYEPFRSLNTGKLAD